MASVGITLDIYYDVGELYTVNLDIYYNVKFTKISGVVRNYLLSPVPCAMIYIYPEAGPAAILQADSLGCFSIEIIEGETISIVIPEASFFDKKFVVPPMPAGVTSIDYKTIDSPPEDFRKRFNISNIRYL